MNELLSLNKENKNNHVISNGSKLTELKCVLPDGIKIGPTSIGYGLFSTKSFRTGDLLYEGKFVIIESDDYNYKLIIKESENSENILYFNMNTIIHGVSLTNNRRIIYYFDSFYNHSCEPSICTFENNYEDCSFNVFALRDILPGEEITCDYSIFEYDCKEKCIDNCFCKSENCLKRVLGFKFLTIEQKKGRFEIVDVDVLKRWADEFRIEENILSKENSDREFVIYDDLLEKYHEGTEIKEDYGSYCITATKLFRKGETISICKSILIPESTNIIVQIGKKRKWLDNLKYTRNIGNRIREYYGYDTFVNHSSNPNSEMKYFSLNEYERIALIDINPGEKITCNIESFHSFVKEH